MAAVGQVTFKIALPQVLTTGEVARLLHMAPRTAGKLIDSGMLRGFRVPKSGGRPGDRRVLRTELVKFCQKYGIPLEELRTVDVGAGDDEPPTDPPPVAEAALSIADELEAA